MLEVLFSLLIKCIIVLICQIKSISLMRVKTARNTLVCSGSARPIVSLLNFITMKV